MPDVFPIGLEWTGESRPTYVARFCDKWLGAYPCAEEARAACAEYDESRWPVQA
jgi:hypothetical protein